MANTFQLIASSIVGSGGVSSINFTSIPSNYTDLCLKMSVRSTRTFGWDAMVLRFNGSTTGYSDKTVAANGASTFSFSNAFTGYMFAGDMNDASTTSNMFSNTDIYISNYASSNKKLVSIESVEENNATTAQSDLVSGLWTGTSAITSIALALFAGTFVQYSSAHLYGIIKQ
jgi:hypothetical protein